LRMKKWLYDWAYCLSESNSEMIGDEWKYAGLVNASHNSPGARLMRILLSLLYLPVPYAVRRNKKATASVVSDK